MFYFEYCVAQLVFIRTAVGDKIVAFVGTNLSAAKVMFLTNNAHTDIYHR